MKKTKTQKGMTLIALVITIVVLLILAIVTINSVIDEGILKQAQEAANTYNNSVGNEGDVLQQYSNFLSNQIANPGSGSSLSGGEGAPCYGSHKLKVVRYEQSGDGSYHYAYFECESCNYELKKKEWCDPGYYVQHYDSWYCKDCGQYNPGSGIT